MPYEHSYPHCWRCHTALLYYAQPSWYIRTTQVKDALLRENEATTWYPSTIKHGRYGDWLENNIDWALSRAATGARRCRSGAAPTTTRSASARWPSSRRSPGPTSQASTRTGPTSTT